jgi:WS/DGAT/MGAT family acyltransferase
VTEVLHLPGAVHRELGGRGGRSPFDRPIGSARALAFVIAPLAEMKAIGHARPHRSTVNDVLLAIVAGGVRRWLLSGRARLPRLRAQIPVSLHHRDESDDTIGNRDSFLNVDLPLAEPDPRARLDAIRAETARRKRLGDAVELYDFFHALARFRHLAGAVERAAASPHEFSLSISNVPGPGAALEVLGRPVERLCTVAEPADHHALRVSAISCAGELAIGLCTDPEALPGVRSLAEAVDRSLAELRAATIE